MAKHLAASWTVAIDGEHRKLADFILRCGLSLQAARSSRGLRAFLSSSLYPLLWLGSAARKCSDCLMPATSGTRSASVFLPVLFSEQKPICEVFCQMSCLQCVTKMRELMADVGALLPSNGSVEASDSFWDAKGDQSLPILFYPACKKLLFTAPIRCSLMKRGVRQLEVSRDVGSQSLSLQLVWIQLLLYFVGLLQSSVSARILL